MGRKRVCILVCLAALAAAAALASAPAGADPEVHYFKLKVFSSGSVTVDYGDDRHQSGSTSGGVDGQASATRRWEIKAVAKSVGAGPLVSTAGIVQGDQVFEANLVDYTILMDQLSETPLCTYQEEAITDNKKGIPAQREGRGEYVRQTTPIKIGGGGALKVEPDTFFGSFCLQHPFDAHGLRFLYGASGNDARIPRGAFNPRSDRSYSHTFPSQANEPREHDLSDLNQLHTFVGHAKLKLQIKAIDEDQYRSRGRKYHDTPNGGNRYFHLVPG